MGRNITSRFMPSSIELRVNFATPSVFVSVYWGSGRLPKSQQKVTAKRYAYWSVRICRIHERIVKFLWFDSLICDAFNQNMETTAN